MFCWRHIFLFCLFVNVSLAKVCSSEGIVPFTGFKFTRTYRVSVYPLTSQRALLITQCEKGKAISSRTVEIQSDRDIDFNTVFGFKFDNPRLLNYSGTTVQLQVSQKYKIARRRLYAKLNLVYFLPYTFVGGLFHCEETSSSKHRELCDPEHATPVSPLVADDSSKHWMSLLMRPVGVVHNVPYLRTASRWDPRFPKLIAWESAVNVNEKYNYDKLELRLVSMAIANTANYVHKLTRLPAFPRGLFTRSNDSSSLSSHLSFFLSTLDSKARYFHIGNLQNIWDSVFQQ